MPRGPHVLTSFSIYYEMSEVQNFDPDPTEILSHSLNLPLVIKNGNFADDLPSYKPPFMGDFHQLGMFDDTEG